MTKTIKQIAVELGVSKPTISKAISELGIQAEQIGNRYVLNEMQISQIKSKLMQKLKTENENKTENSQENLKKTEKIANDQSFQFLQSQLDVLAQQLTTKDKLIEQLQTELAAERQHSREQADKLSVLADQAQKLQLAQLATSEQQPSALIENPEPQPKHKKWAFWKK